MRQPADTSPSPSPSPAAPGETGDALRARLGRVRELARPLAVLPGPVNFPPFSLPPFKGLLLRLINRMSAGQREAMEQLAHVLELSIAQAEAQSAELAGAEARNAPLRAAFPQVEDDLEALRGNVGRVAERLAGLALAQRAAPVAAAAHGATTAETAPAALPVTASGSDFDQFYAAFETAFRGDQAMVEARQADYLPLLRAALPAGKPVFDIGCGRGEWLGLVARQGWSGTGWDINSRFVEDNRAAGLDVHHGDALAEIARIAREAPGSLGAITAFHVVEHIPFSALLTLVDNALIALADGGLIIFETPNPENLAVGACTFYTDPTHERPLHPATLAFMAERAGFVQAQSWRLTTERGIVPLACPADQPTLAPLVQLLNQHLAAGPDFALVARKGHAIPPGVQP